MAKRVLDLIDLGGHRAGLFEIPGQRCFGGSSFGVHSELELLERRSKSDVRQHLGSLRANLVKCVEHADVVVVHQAGNRQAGRPAHSNFAVHQDLRLGSTPPCRLYNFDELSDRWSNVLVHLISRRKIAVFEWTVEKLHLGPQPLGKATHNMGDSRTHEFINIVDRRPSPEEHIWCYL